MLLKVLVVTISTVFFDLYFTLVYHHPHRVERQALTLKEFGFEVDEISLHRGYLAADHYYTRAGLEFPIHLLTPEERHRVYTRFQQVIMETVGLGHVAQMAEEIYRRYWEKSREFRPFPDAIPALDQLRGQGYRLGLITNVSDDPSKDLEKVGLRDRFDVVIASCLAGFEKPDPRIFRVALEAMGVEPSEAVHVGDQYLADVDGATSAGIRAVLLDRYDLQNGLHPYRVRSLLELPELLRGLRTED